MFGLWLFEDRFLTEESLIMDTSIKMNNLI